MNTEALLFSAWSDNGHRIGIFMAQASGLRHFDFMEVFMAAEYGTLQDIDSWMELVKRVHLNFPGLETEAAMEDHRQTVLRFMGEHRALCAKDGDKVRY